LPAKRIPADVRSLARAYTKAAIDRLAGAVTSPPEGTPLATSVQAAVALLDRGWGKPTQTIAGDAEAGPVIVEIIQRVREKQK
jgi:hypothetical protein